MNTNGTPLDEPLSQTLASLLARDSTAGEITLGHVVQRIGDRGFGLLLIVLSLPSALPIPAPGYSTPFGILIAILALQMLAGRCSPWLPQKASAMKIQGKFADQMLAFAGKFFAKVEFLIRPRFRWVGSRGGLSFLGILVLIMACLMILPIPLTNTFPAFVIFLIGIGLTEEDGLACIGAAILGVLSVLLYGFVVYFFLRFGMQGIDMIKDWIRSMM